MTSELSFRRPTEADHPDLVGRMDDWWGGRKVHQQFPRLWLQHFAGTSWLAEDDRGATAGFVVGFISPDRPDEAVAHLIAASPNHRRAGVGRALYEQFFADVRARGARRVTAVVWPGDPVAVAFHRAMGFAPSEGPGSMNLYGTPAYPDYDWDGDDRVVFTREL